MSYGAQWHNPLWSLEPGPRGFLLYGLHVSSCGWTAIVVELQLLWVCRLVGLACRWPKFWCFSFSISSSNAYPGLISCKIDLFGLIRVQGLSRVFSSTTIWKHQFFRAQSSLWNNSHMLTWLLEKPITDYMDFVSKVLSLFFNILSRFVIALLIIRQSSLSVMSNYLRPHPL